MGTLFCQKFIDGVPQLAEVVDLSPNGLLLRTPRAGHKKSDRFSIALDVPGNPTRLWLWARTVRRGHMGTSVEEAVELIGTELFDRASLAQLVRWRATH